MSYITDARAATLKSRYVRLCNAEANQPETADYRDVTVSARATGVHCYASKFLVDGELGIQREVDVVAEMPSEGTVVTHSFEVVGRTRPMDLFWVDGMLRKHQTLATDRLFLVSWSGFSKDAVRRVQLSPGVVAVTVGNVGGALSLYADQVNVTLRRATMQIRLPDGTISTVMGAQDTGLHAHDGSLRGTLWQLGTWMLQHPTSGRMLTEQAHNDPRRKEIPWFELNVPLASMQLERLFLFHDAASELHELVALNLQGDSSFRRKRSV